MQKEKKISLHLQKHVKSISCSLTNKTAVPQLCKNQRREKLGYYASVCSSLPLIFTTNHSPNPMDHRYLHTFLIRLTISTTVLVLQKLNAFAKYQRMI